MYRSVFRKPTKEEAGRLLAKKRTNPLVRWGCGLSLALLVFVTLGFAAAAGAFGGAAIAEHLYGHDAVSKGFWAGGALVLLVLGVAAFRDALTRHRPGVPRRGRERVEELEVSAERLVMLVPDETNGLGMTLGFDLGEGKLLLLHGPWLFDPATYGATSADPQEPGRFNRLAGVHGFPCPRFRLTRAESSGVALSIRPESEYQEPPRKVWSGTLDVDRPEVELLEGDLDRLPPYEPPQEDISHLFSC